MLKVGIAKVNINPPLGTLLAGQLHERRTVGVDDDLFIRALVIDNGNTNIVFITADLVAIKRTTTETIRKTIEQTLKIRREHIIISATHTHSGPLTIDLFGTPADKSYLQFLIKKIIGAVKEALNNLQTAKISFASGKAAGISFNRRFIMRNDTIETHPFKGNPEILKSEGPVDPEVGVLYIADSNDEVIGILVNFACHATCMERESLMISADYPGCIEKAICRELDREVIVLFANGASGNICQVDVNAPDKNEVGSFWADKMGRVIGREVLRIKEEVEYLSEIKIEVKNKNIKIPLREISSAQLTEAESILSETNIRDDSRAILSDYGSEGMEREERRRQALSVEDIFSTSFWERLQSKEILLFDKERRKKAYVDVEITVITLNNSAFVALPGELFTEFGLEIKKNSKYAPTFIIELANGYIGYIPTHKAFERKGGYETKLARSSKLIHGAGDIITKAALELLENK